MINWGENMRFRIALGHFVSRLGKFFQSLAVVVMKPADLIELNKEFYSRPKSVETLCGKHANLDLSLNETTLLGKVPINEGKILVLGMGGGRELFPLARMGFEVTGVDFVPEIVKKAKENANRRGLKISTLLQDISELDVPAESFDIVWLTTTSYSEIPTRSKRIKTLKKIKKALCPRGYLACQFFWSSESTFSSHYAEFVRKISSCLFGNFRYEKGDNLLNNNMRFLHTFSSEDALRSEFEMGGFEVVYIRLPEKGRMGEGVLQKV